MSRSGSPPFRVRPRQLRHDRPSLSRSPRDQRRRGDAHFESAIVGWVERRDDQPAVVDHGSLEPAGSAGRSLVVRRDPGTPGRRRTGTGEVLRNHQVHWDAIGAEPRAGLPLHGGQHEAGRLHHPVERYPRLHASRLRLRLRDHGGAPQGIPRRRKIAFSFSFDALGHDRRGVDPVAQTGSREAAGAQRQRREARRPRRQRREAAVPAERVGEAGHHLSATTQSEPIGHTRVDPLDPEVTHCRRGAMPARALTSACAASPPLDVDPRVNTM